MKFIPDKMSNTMRWAMIFSYVFVIVVVFGVWASVSLLSNGLPEFAIIAALATSIIGIATGGKYLEKREETKKEQGHVDGNTDNP